MIASVTNLNPSVVSRDITNDRETGFISMVVTVLVILCKNWEGRSIRREELAFSMVAVFILTSAWVEKSIVVIWRIVVSQGFLRLVSFLHGLVGS